MWAKVWAWLKRYWYWILIPVLLLLILFPRGRRYVVTNLQGLTADDAIKQHEVELKRREAEAQQAYLAKVENIEAEHKAAIDKLDAQQKAEYQELKSHEKSDPQKITDWLIAVGKGK